MKKHRKQSVNVFGQKQLVDVPVDDKLYEMDNHEEYQRRRSKAKHISLDDIIMAGMDIMEDYEEAQLLKCLHEALRTLTEKEYRLVKYIFYNGFTDSETAAILKISQQAVTKQKHKIIQKLRNNLADWM